MRLYVASNRARKKNNFQKKNFYQEFSLKLFLVKSS